MNAPLADTQAVNYGSTPDAPAQVQMSDQETGQGKSGASEDWNNSFCCCFRIKGSGCMPCCIPNTLCCMCCMWGSAMSQIRGKEEWGSYNKCCILAGLCP
eukprot:TRINITY_DN67181_c0_g1_i1.p1 TRINITY_DN67181_c0_g1~~TRINITY_DN67181_c0_g1_i1.p1  ORF type:complete len:100 (+),score=14.06 TRINITY_DN67181_c0_g1_i1:143-442(+)